MLRQQEIKKRKENFCDYAFLNGSVITVDQTDTIFEAIGIKDNKILWVGSNEEVKEFVSDETTIYDLKGKNINYFDLPVKYGFHSSNIEPFYDVFMNEVADITLKKAKIPVYSCSQCRPVGEYTKDMLWNVVRNNIMYREVLQKYVKENDVLIDVGPQGTLAGFSKKILNRTSGIFSTMTLFNQEQKAISQIEDYVNNNKAN